MNKCTKYSFIAIIVVCFFSFFINNNVIPADLMESRNLATAQEMVRTGNYLVPTLNQELRLEKPPLPTWIAAGIEHVLPHSLSAQRAVAAVAATFMVVFLFLLVRRLTKEDNLALIAALVLATSYNVIMMGRTATWDIFCHSFMMGAIYFFVYAFDSEGGQWRNFSLAGAFMGLSFLSKGPVSFFALLLPFIISYGAVIGFPIKGKVGPLIFAVVICLILSLWWPAFIAVFHPEAGVAVASKESGAWFDHNVRPIWYYWKFPAEAGIWAFFWLTSIVYFFFRKREQYHNIFKLSIIWTISSFVLLSLVPEKKTRYLLPLLIPGAMNVAFYIWYSINTVKNKIDTTIFRVNGLLATLIALSMPIALYFISREEGGLRVIRLALISLVFIAVGLYILRGLYVKKRIMAGRVFAGVVVLMICFVVFCYKPATLLFINEDRKSLADLRDNGDLSDLSFYVPKDDFIRMELVYELDRAIMPLDLSDERQVESALPFVLLVGERSKPDFQGAALRSEYLGTFDNNWRKPESRRHNKDLVKSAYLLTK